LNGFEKVKNTTLAVTFTSFSSYELDFRGYGFCAYLPLTLPTLTSSLMRNSDIYIDDPCFDGNYFGDLIYR
jgi:hypothetical protein